MAKNTAEKTKKKIGLSTQIFIALLIGALFGVVIHYWIPSSYIKDTVIVEGVLYVVGQGFIRLMQMLVVPLVFCSLVLLKVIEAKRMLSQGKAKNSSEAARLAGISRSAFYKYKDGVSVYGDDRRNKIVTRSEEHTSELQSRI